MAEQGAFPAARLNFPQGPFFDPATQELSLEWFMWLQSLRALISEIIDIQAISNIFPSSAPASVATVQKQVDALKVQLAMIDNPIPLISTISKKLDAFATMLAMQSQFNPGTLNKRIDALAVMGVFV